MLVEDITVPISVYEALSIVVFNPRMLLKLLGTLPCSTDFVPMLGSGRSQPLTVDPAAADVHALRDAPQLHASGREIICVPDGQAYHAFCGQMPPLSVRVPH